MPKVKRSGETSVQPMSYQEAAHLLNPLRKFLLSPKKLVRRLHLRQDAKVLEIGPGPGFYSGEIARSIPSGTLTLFDIQQEMLDLAKNRLEGMGVSNVQYVRGDAARLPMDSESFDAVVLVCVLGEIPNRDQCLQEVRRILRPNGLLSVTEQLGDPDFISRGEMRNLVTRNGFALDKSFGFWKNYTLNFKKSLP